MILANVGLSRECDDGNIARWLLIHMHNVLDYSADGLQMGCECVRCRRHMLRCPKLVCQENVLMATLPVVMLAHPPAQCAGLFCRRDWAAEGICCDAKLGFQEIMMMATLPVVTVAHPSTQCANA